MREKKLSARMKKEAVELGLCDQWTREWEDGTTKDEMVDKFVRGLDFCIEHDWPTTDVMKKEFGDVIHRHGVWVDEAMSANNPDTAILNGSCDGRITVDGFGVSSIYVRHKSRLKLTVKDMAYAAVSLYDEANVDIDCQGGKCFVYKRGDNVKVKTQGGVKIRENRNTNQ